MFHNVPTVTFLTLLSGNLARITLSISKEAESGGYNLLIKIMQGTKSCRTVITEQSKDFSTGSVLIWKGENLGTCANMHFEMDDTITFKMKTFSKDWDKARY